MVDVFCVRYPLRDEICTRYLLLRDPMMAVACETIACLFFFGLCALHVSEME